MYHLKYVFLLLLSYFRIAIIKMVPRESESCNNLRPKQQNRLIGVFFRSVRFVYSSFKKNLYSDVDSGRSINKETYAYLKIYKNNFHNQEEKALDTVVKVIITSY